MNIAMVVMSEQAAVSASGSVFRDANDAADRRGFPFPRRAPCRNTHGSELPAGRLVRIDKAAFPPGRSVCCLNYGGDVGSKPRPRPFPPASGSPQPIFGEAHHVPVGRFVSRSHGGRGGPANSAPSPSFSRPLDVCQDHRGGVSNRHERSGVVHAKHETPAWIVRPSFLQRQIIIRSTE